MKARALSKSKDRRTCFMVPEEERLRNQRDMSISQSINVSSPDALAYKMIEVESCGS